MWDDVFIEQFLRGISNGDSHAHPPVDIRKTETETGIGDMPAVPGDKVVNGMNRCQGNVERVVCGRLGQPEFGDVNGGQSFDVRQNRQHMELGDRG